MADDEKVAQGHCPKCGPDRKATVEGYYRVEDDDNDTGVWGRTEYRILICRGCDTPFFQTKSVFSEDVQHVQDWQGEWREVLNAHFEHWPAATKRDEPSWIGSLHAVNRNFADLFSDIYRCLNADLHVPAVVAIRTAFDCATELLGIDPALRFSEKLDALVAQGKISVDERQTLDIVVDAGSAAAHRGWRPTPAELGVLVSLIEAFVHRQFVLGNEAAKIKAAMPAKQKRTKPPSTTPTSGTSAKQ